MTDRRPCFHKVAKERLIARQKRVHCLPFSIPFDSPPSLSASTQYTVMLYGNGSQVSLSFTPDDVYAGGTRRSDELGFCGDIAFRLYFSDVPVELMSFSVE